jgi:AraC-like DNA-binding protein
MSIFRTTFCFLAFFQSAFSISPQQKAVSIDPPCMVFETPAYGSLIKSATCTLSLSACQDVQTVHFNACFFPGSGMTDTILDLGTISQPPFKLMWNVAEVPNQLFRGMWFSADATLKSGSHLLARQDGVFLYTRQAGAMEINLPSPADQQKMFFVDTLPSIGAPMVLDVLGNWNSQELHFTVLVMDPAFSMSVPKEKLSELGVVVCLDPLITRLPYPTESSLILSFPLLNKPSRFIYKKINDRGNLNFTIDTVEFPYPATIKTAEGKGYGLDIVIPRSLFTYEMPDSLLCNIQMKVLNRNRQVSVISSNRAPSSEAMCPLLWMMIRRQQNGFFSNPLYVFLVCFAAGCLIALLVGFLVSSRSAKTVAFNKLDLSEDDKQLAKTIHSHLEQNVTNKEMNLTEVSRELSIPNSKIESLIKKYNGLSFKKYLLHARVEIAKERLRSSHASESSIAESCGFKSIDEMEKSFVKQCRTTPFRYRRDNQVA